MRRLLPILVILLVGCSGGPGSSPADGQTNASSAPTDPGAPAASAEPGGSSAPPTEASTAPSEAPSAAAGALPADCAEGLATFLASIEPQVSNFDLASGTLRDLLEADRAAGDTAYELLQANDSTAPYSCPEAGLDWAYFDSDSPWEAVLVVASDAAPGTVGYLTGLRAMSALDVDPVSTYGVEGCDAVVASLKERVAAQLSDDVEGVADMAFSDAVALFGLYRAYMRDVQNEVCPRDDLGNDEFDFMSSGG